MRRRLVMLLAGFIVLTAIAVAAMTRSAPSPAEAPKAPVAGPAAPSGVEMMGARAHAAEAAMKDLDLIRPARRKLADDFTVKTSDGGSFRLSAHRGHVVMINFWATWCPPCLEEMPAMQRLYDRHRKDRFLMLAVSVDADPRVVAPFVKERKFTFTIGLDPKMELANAYGVRGLPASFIVDGEGHLAALALGPRPWDTNAAHALVQGMTR